MAGQTRCASKDDDERGCWSRAHVGIRLVERQYRNYRAGWPLLQDSAEIMSDESIPSYDRWLQMKTVLKGTGTIIAARIFHSRSLNGYGSDLKAVRVLDPAWVMRRGPHRPRDLYLIAASPARCSLPTPNSGRHTRAHYRSMSPQPGFVYTLVSTRIPSTSKVQLFPVLSRPSQVMTDCHYREPYIIAVNSHWPIHRQMSKRKISAFARIGAAPHDRLSGP